MATIETRLKFMPFLFLSVKNLTIENCLSYPNTMQC